MKTNSFKPGAIACALALTTGLAQAWDFTYGYQNVYAANADAYLVSAVNAVKVTEWQAMPYTYWGPSFNNVQGILTYKWTFAAPTTQVHLQAQLTTFNWTGGPGFGMGSASLWGSTDGASWQLLLNDPTPPNGTYGSDIQYNQDLPGSLLGGNTLWLQVLMDQSGAAGIAKDAQFGRTDSSVPGNVFELNALLVPEPSACSLGALAALAAFRARKWRRQPAV